MLLREGALFLLRERLQKDLLHKGNPWEGTLRSKPPSLGRPRVQGVRATSKGLRVYD